MATTWYLDEYGRPIAEPLFDGGGSWPKARTQMVVRRADMRVAAVLNEMWHSDLPDFPVKQARDYLAFVAEFDNRLYASAIWTPPVARRLNGRGMFELRRFAVGPDCPPKLASWMLRRMVKALSKLRPSARLAISYQDADLHRGEIYKYAGWTPAAETVTSGAGWTNRDHRKIAGISRRIRWEKAIPIAAE